jgi:hypothetical protein
VRGEVIATAGRWGESRAKSRRPGSTVTKAGDLTIHRATSLTVKQQPWSLCDCDFTDTQDRPKFRSNMPSIIAAITLKFFIVRLLLRAYMHVTDITRQVAVGQCL